MNEYLFYDTSALLANVDHLFKPFKFFIISSVSLNELERLKDDERISVEKRAAARKVNRLLKDNIDRYVVWDYKPAMLKPIEEKGYEINNDMKILATALDYDKKVHPDETVFITNDLSQYNIANVFFGKDSIRILDDEVDNYCGVYTVQLSDEEMAHFYANQSENIFNLKKNQYLILENQAGEIVDRKCWDGEFHRSIYFVPFESQQFGVVRPAHGDTEQQFAFDSLLHNQITMLRGKAGSGKSLLALGFLFYQLERGKIDKIIVICNTIAAKGAARLGFYPGSREEKLLDSQIGNMLTSKLGSRIALEQLLEEEKLVLMPMSDIRGYDTTGMKAGVYITEAQNLDINLMKLALQRIGEDSICIIDGDDKTQVDDALFAGVNNGMKRASQVFRGKDIYGEVELKTIHRSRIGQIADNM